MNDSAEKLEDFILNNDKLWIQASRNRKETEKLEWKFKELGNKLKTSSPLTPFNFFSMNSSALLTAFITTLTYMVVLLQFKATEVGMLCICNKS